MCNETLSIISDLHKDAYGYRPRGKYLDWSEQELKEETTRLLGIIDENVAEEERIEKLKIVEFKAMLETLINVGANDEKTALRWLLDGHTAEYGYPDPEHLMWSHGILYSDYYKSEIKPILFELTEELSQQG